MDRPHVHMNLAATADGKIDTFERRGATISSARDKQRVDRLRAYSDAIMVGGRTLHDEDPGLTVKAAELREERKALGRPEYPAKVGIATRLQLNMEGRFLTAGPARVLLFTTPSTTEEELGRLRARGAEVFVQEGKRIDLISALRTLHEEGIQRLMVEGGATLNFELLKLGLVDELTIFVAPVIFGGETAPTVAGGFGLSASAAVKLELLKCEGWDDGGVLMHYELRRGR
jgi:2,5-diamino-6-(ribosylamino)-4(3H)-pyrimidinone 5'-phosphate reductase